MKSVDTYYPSYVIKMTPYKIQVPIAILMLFIYLVLFFKHYFKIFTSGKNVQLANNKLDNDNSFSLFLRYSVKKVNVNL